MQKTGKTILVLIVILAIVALIAYMAKPKMTAAPATSGDPETSMIREEATQDFSSSDDVNSIEADLNASIEQMQQ